MSMVSFSKKWQSGGFFRITGAVDAYYIRAADRWALDK